MTVDLRLGDCLEVMRTLPENSVDTCITDPPYELGFMGKRWDSSGVAFQPATWAEVYRVLKPGALLLAFGGTRTYHRMVCAIEDAGFEIRDTIAWVYGSGFPKSHNISKALDKMAGAEREVVGHVDKLQSYGYSGNNCYGEDIDRQGIMNITAPATPAAQLWDGWGTALKPAFEPIVIAQKPLDGTYAENALKWGVAGLWIDGGRVATDADDPNRRTAEPYTYGKPNDTFLGALSSRRGDFNNQGRFPANFIHDGSDEVLELMPETGNGNGKMTITARQRKASWREMEGREDLPSAEGMAIDNYGDSGSAARFFYCAKASRSERNAGLEGMDEKHVNKMGSFGSQVGYECSDGASRVGDKGSASMQNFHPTVKPLALMRYLVRLTKTPTGGVVLDPFMGSGTTGCACVLEGRDFIGIEREAEYMEIAEKRIAHAQGAIPVELPLFAEVE